MKEIRRRGNQDVEVQQFSWHPTREGAEHAYAHLRRRYKRVSFDVVRDGKGWTVQGLRVIQK